MKLRQDERGGNGSDKGSLSAEDSWARDSSQLFGTHSSYWHFSYVCLFDRQRSRRDVSRQFLSTPPTGTEDRRLLVICAALDAKSAHCHFSPLVAALPGHVELPLPALVEVDCETEGWQWERH